MLIAPADCYGGSWRLFDAWARRRHFRLRLWDPEDPEDLTAALAEGPSMVWIETPSNPLLRLTDIADVAARARAVAALTVVDNTFLSPVLQRPLDLGADLVVHSTTKYLTATATSWEGRSWRPRPRSMKRSRGGPTRSG